MCTYVLCTLTFPCVHTFACAPAQVCAHSDARLQHRETYGCGANGDVVNWVFSCDVTASS